MAYCIIKTLRWISLLAGMMVYIGRIKAFLSAIPMQGNDLSRSQTAQLPDL